jgi:hypothetical protein
MRLCEFSIQGNHAHFIVEAADERSLARGLQGLAIRLAKALNREFARHGKVFAERYHAHILRTPAEVKRAIQYVHRNWHKHVPSEDPRWVDPRSSACGEAVWIVVEWPLGEPSAWDIDAASASIVARPRTWLLTHGRFR